MQIDVIARVLNIFRRIIESIISIMCHCFKHLWPFKVDNIILIQLEPLCVNKSA